MLKKRKSETCKQYQTVCHKTVKNTAVNEINNNTVYL